MVSREARASATRGAAASRSLWVEVFFSSTSTLITAHFSASILAMAFSFSTISFSFPTIAANESASSFLASASIYFSLTSTSIMATCSSVSLNLIRPFSYLSILARSSPFFLSSMEVNRLISSRKDFGVVQAYLLSYWRSQIPRLLTRLNENGINLITFSLTVSSPKSQVFKKLLATLQSAS